MNIKKLLGKRIQEIRKSMNLTQEKVAEIVEIETASLSNIENGKYYPTAENLEKIIKVLETSPQKLFSFEHLQNPDELKQELYKLIEENPDKLQDIYKIVKAFVE